jgi:galactokinase
MNPSTTARAYGRVNLIGEHTDYNGGWVLPTAIPQFTEVTVTSAPGRIVRLESSGGRAFSYELGSEEKTGTWVDYLQGATRLLADRLAGKPGLSVTIRSTVPEGSGLSSSAALEISFLKALNEHFDLNLDPVTMARLGQRIENEFVGARVGIMDQMATGLARAGEALFIDTLTLEYERIRLPLDAADLLVINSGISHRLSASDGGYNQRRAECEEACRRLGVNLLRDLAPEVLAARELPEPFRRRARHVVSENQRVKDAVLALKNRDLKKLGQLFLESHLSMKNDYQVSIPEIDLLVDLCMTFEGVYGARLTGGGFGGSIVALTRKGLAATVAPAVIASYAAETGERATRLL